MEELTKKEKLKKLCRQNKAALKTAYIYGHKQLRLEKMAKKMEEKKLSFFQTYYKLTDLICKLEKES